MAHKIEVDSKYTKTYKTEANLEKAVEKLNLPQGVRYLVFPLEDRFAPVFILNSNNPEHSPWLCELAHKGFKVIM